MKNRSTGRLGRLFSAVIPECLYRGSQPYEKTTRFPIPTFGNDVRNRCLRGFTLIELLVVVLIIGILAAVALPQYQKAVLRSRYAQTQILARNLYDALQRYYLANGEYPVDLTDLDIQVAGAFSEDNSNVVFGNYRCTYYFRKSNVVDSVLCVVTDSDFFGTRYFLDKNSPDKVKRYCIAKSGAVKEQEICQAETGATPFDSGAGGMHYEYDS